jgi:cytochrome P450
VHAPDEFRPERWYERGEGSPFARDVHEAYKPFSSGPGTCLGREMALNTLQLMAAKLAFKYDIDMVNKDAFLWERDAASAALYSKYNIMVRVAEHKEAKHGTQLEQLETMAVAA